MPRFKNMKKVSIGKYYTWANSRKEAIKNIAKDIKKYTLKDGAYVATMSNIKELRRGLIGDIKKYSCTLTILRKRNK